MVPAGTAPVVDFIRQLQLRIQVSGIHIAGQIGRTVIDPGIFVNLAAEILGAVGTLFPDNLRILHIFFVAD